MPISPKFAAILNAMQKRYGAKRGKQIYYGWLTKHKLDDTKETIPELAESELSQLNETDGFKGNIRQLTLDNNYFRNVIYTNDLTQISLMCVPPKTDLGLEVHKVEQTLFFIQGECEADVDGKKWVVREGDVVVVPAGTRHDFTNTGEGTLKLYTIYSPPEHPAGTIHKTKADALKDESVQSNSESVMKGNQIDESYQQVLSDLVGILGEIDGVRYYEKWRDGHRLDESKPYPYTEYLNIDHIIKEVRESEATITEDTKLRDAQIFTFKALAIYPTVSANNRKYTRDVLERDIGTFLGKPVIFDHDQEHGADKVCAKITKTYYGMSRLPNWPSTVPDREGGWMEGIGITDKLTFAKMHGLGPMPPILDRVSIGAGGTANPALGRTGADGKSGVDIMTMSGAELSFTPFPGVDDAEIHVEPVDFQESVKSLLEFRESVVTKKPLNEPLMFKLDNLASKILDSMSTTIIQNNEELNNRQGGDVRNMNNESGSGVSSPPNGTEQPDNPTKRNPKEPNALTDTLIDKVNNKPPVRQGDNAPNSKDSNTKSPYAGGETMSNDKPTPEEEEEDKRLGSTLAPEDEMLVDEFVYDYRFVQVSEAKSKKWMQKAVKHPGSLRAAAKKAGVVKGDEPIPVSWIRGKAKGNSTTARRARLALTFRKFRGGSKEMRLADILANESLMSQLTPIVLRRVFSEQEEEEEEESEPSASSDQPPSPSRDPTTDTSSSAPSPGQTGGGSEKPPSAATDKLGVSKDPTTDKSDANPTPSQSAPVTAQVSPTQGGGEPSLPSDSTVATSGNPNPGVSGVKDPGDDQDPDDLTTAKLASGDDAAIADAPKDKPDTMGVPPKTDSVAELTSNTSGVAMNQIAAGQATAQPVTMKAPSSLIKEEPKTVLPKDPTVEKAKQTTIKEVLTVEGQQPITPAVTVISNPAKPTDLVGLTEYYYDDMVKKGAYGLTRTAVWEIARSIAVAELTPKPPERHNSLGSRTVAK